MALMVISVAVGTAMSASLISIALQISGKVSRELRAFGANIRGTEEVLKTGGHCKGQDHFLEA
jgi:hypothetical protein